MVFFIWKYIGYDISCVIILGVIVGYEIIYVLVYGIDFIYFVGMDYLVFYCLKFYGVDIERFVVEFV